MKKTLLSVAVLSIASFSVQIAHANDGKITFNGNVTAQTCQINKDSSKDFEVTLPTVSTSTLSGAGKTAGTTRFEISLTECSAGITNVRAFFEHANGTTTDGRLKNSSATGATNVEIELVRGEDVSPIIVGAPVATQGVLPVTVIEGNAKLVYAARYYATGAAGPGPVVAQTVYTIAYQ
ncbi:fimbrial protein [Achromobacter marplatensis]|uniref:fimbrial protein n=1 Tax=Achromobacter marplatensis TaxID=470868 RepID=UPI0039F6EF58